MLSDLRDSGSIEAEADVVLFIHREEYYGDREATPPVDPPPGFVRQEEVELIVAKQRNGPTGKVIIAFQPDYSRFVSIDREHTGVY
jgi:replicative DNA helicase